MKIPRIVAKSLSHMTGGEFMAVEYTDCFFWYLLPDRVEHVKAYLLLHNIPIEEVLVEHATNIWTGGDIQISLKTLQIELEDKYTRS